MTADRPIARRDFLRSAGALAASAGALPTFAAAPRERVAYVGTFTAGTGSEGIYVCAFDTRTGRLRIRETVGGVVQPGFLALHPTSRFLYSVAQVRSDDGVGTGGIVSFAVNRATGALSELNRRTSGGANAAHVEVDRTGRVVIASNYGGGTVGVLPIARDGTVGPPAQVLRHTGSGPNQARQKEPHPHSARVSPSGRHVYVPDLGIDRVMIYGLDPRAPRLTPGVVPASPTPPGAGPRHMDFHPSGHLAFVIHELTSTLASHRVDRRTGALTPVSLVSTLPSGFTGRNSCADVHVHPNGRFVYGSNRGHDSIVVAAIQPHSGELSVVQHHPTGGRTPRNFAIAPGGRFLLAENQESGTIVTLAIDPDTGRLADTGEVLRIPAPVCLIFPRG